MVVKAREVNMTVSQMAEKRIENVFSNGVKVYMSVSGGKDSIVLFDLVMTMVEQGRVDKDLMIVQFVDEEAVYPEVIDIVHDMRKRCMLSGVPFEWYAMEFKHFNCLSTLETDESFITFDRYKEEVWVRRPPKFAIRNHYMLRPRQDTYQEFFGRANRDGITIMGVRAAESIQRRNNLASAINKRSLNHSNSMQPIYDFRDTDIWLYILNKGLKYPETYKFLYQTGRKKSEMRLSQMFSIDTVKSLVDIQESYPELFDRILLREPNAYLASMYWDTEMFRRQRNVDDSEVANEDGVKKLRNMDYDAEIMNLYHNFDKHFTSKLSRNVARDYFNLYLRDYLVIDDGIKKIIYNALIAGDPKKRTYRSLLSTVANKRMQKSLKEESNNGH